MEDQRIAWAITGAGHFLAECAERLLRYENVGKLRGFEGVTVVKSVEELERCLDTCL